MEIKAGFICEHLIAYGWSVIHQFTLPDDELCCLCDECAAQAGYCIWCGAYLGEHECEKCKQTFSGDSSDQNNNNS